MLCHPLSAHPPRPRECTHAGTPPSAVPPACRRLPAGLPSTPRPSPRSAPVAKLPRPSAPPPPSNHPPDDHRSAPPVDHFTVRPSRLRGHFFCGRLRPHSPAPHGPAAWSRSQHLFLLLCVRRGCQVRSSTDSLVPPAVGSAYRLCCCGASPALLPGPAGLCCAPCRN